MGLFQTQKPKSAGKLMIPKGDKLAKLVLDTLQHMAQMAGATLGPSGGHVLIERTEMNMKPIITKDGVTVIKNLGYSHPIKQLILESARDAALRTASEAGDGTTTSTILSAAIAEYTHQAVSENPKVSPQSIVREMKAMMPQIKETVYEHRISATGDDFADVLYDVAVISANGDEPLAEAVMDAFDTVGEEGNLTIIEDTGESSYEVERISGYTVDMGYEESLKKFSQGFINDRSGSMVGLNNPIFILYDGIVNDIRQVIDGMNMISEYFDEVKVADRNVVLVAHGFSNAALGDFHVNWTHESTMDVFPLLTPQRAIANWKTQFLYDLQAYTGSPVFNPLDRPLTDMNVAALYKNNLVTAFECSRFRASIMSKEDTELIDLRVDELKEQLKKPESQYEANDLEVRIGKLTSGIARLIVTAPSQGETREKRDRAEDAWMAIRGAIKHGACPGGGFVLVRVAEKLAIAAESGEGATAQVLAREILWQAMLEPVKALYRNYGFSEQELGEQLAAILQNNEETFDISSQQWVPKHELLDSVPAVTEAIESSVSIASLLGTLGGIVSFNRDFDSDKGEETFERGFRRSIGEE